MIDFLTSDLFILYYLFSAILVSGMVFEDKEMSLAVKISFVTFSFYVLPVTIGIKLNS